MCFRPSAPSAVSRRYRHYRRQTQLKSSIKIPADGADGRFHCPARRRAQPDDPNSGVANTIERNLNPQRPKRGLCATQSASKSTRRPGPICATSRSCFGRKLSAKAQEAPTLFPSRTSAEPSDPGCKRQRGPPPQRLRLPSDDWRHRRAGTRPKSRNSVRMPSPTAQNQPSVAGDPVGPPAACASHG